MTAEVVSLDSHRPHISGEVRCLVCGHTAHAVAPVGTYEMECGNCGLHQAVWCAPVIPDQYWECHCGSRVFSMAPGWVAVCVRCGLEHTEE